MMRLLPQTHLYTGNLRAAGRLFARRPQLLSVVARNLLGRARYVLSRGGTPDTSRPPEQVTVLVTDLCNLRCKMCQYAWSDDPANQLSRAGKMTLPLFRKVMDEVPGRPLISFTGGEPLLHAEVPEFIAYAKSKGRFCTLTTNGWMLADHAEAISRAGLDVLVVSVDGPQEVHDRVRGPRSFERLARGIEAVMRQPSRPLVFVSVAIMDINYDQLLATYDLAGRWRVDGVNFNHLWVQVDDLVDAHNQQFADLYLTDRVGWNLLPSAVNVDVVAEQLETIRALNARGTRVVVETPPLTRQEMAVWYREPERRVKWKTTRCAWIRMKVCPDGKVKPCRGYEAGNIVHEHAMQVWNSPRFRLLRQTLAERGTLPICARCCALAHR